MKSAIVLGGTHDHIKLIQLLKQKGYYTILIDYFKNPPAKEIADDHIEENALDKETVLNIACKLKVNIVVSICIDQALHVMAYVSEKLNLPCHITYEQSLNITDKNLMKSILKNNGILTSNYIHLKNDIENHGLNFPVVVKPTNSNSSKGVFKVNKPDELNRFIEKSLSFNGKRKELILEEYIEGEEFSVDIWLSNGLPNIIMISQNLKRNGNQNDFTITANLFNKDFISNYKSKIKSIALQISTAFNLFEGPLLIQLIKQKEKFYVIEFSARIGGGSKHLFLQAITGVDLIKKFIDGNNLNIKEINYPNFGIMKYIYTNNSNHVISDICNLEKLKSQKIIENFFIYKKNGSKIFSNMFSSNRVAGIMLIEEDGKTLNDKLFNAIDGIEIIGETGSSIYLKEHMII